MPQNTEFIFSNIFNSQYINELYDGDLVMMEETFADVLKEYDPFLQNIQTCYGARDVGGLKSAVHKIKPLCGYVGLTDLQSQCQQFENDCQHAEFGSLAAQGTDLINNLLRAKSIIAEENVRLSHFNKG
jgi:HPt (histidine-containing phosphotransfer) domain-containing protein